jgi:hypothetical protein
MHGVERLKRVIMALPEVELRVGWLREKLTLLPIERSAELLDRLCEDGERADPHSREGVLAVALLFAGLGECEFVERLREEAIGRKLFSLDRLLRRASRPPQQERSFQELPVPDYGTGRELTVGERRSLARRPNRRSFEKLLLDPHPLVITQLLQNPKLVEDDVVRMVARRPARVDVLEAIARMPRWLSRQRVRLALLLNPGTPPSIAMPLLGTCTRVELREVIMSTDTPVTLRVTARELLQRRPPLTASEDPTLH